MPDTPDVDNAPLENRYIRDPIHDYITVDARVSQFIDTRQFQRLRSIKQLAACYYVWPGASHNRFEHCLGVYHLARKMVDHLKCAQASLNITSRDVFCVSVAGLCHDLGHGPWSHAWDGLFMPKASPGAPAWKHEQGSEMMFDFMVADNGIELEEKDAVFIKALIRGDHSRCPTEKAFLFDIVANERNGIDVDKFDYILRDGHMIGDKGNLSMTRLIESARVIEGQICYEIKNADQIYELCHARFSLHKRIYNHKTTRAIEHMIVDALLAAESVYKFTKDVYNPERFIFLTDDIMPLIERSTEPELKTSRDIISRIRSRQLYRMVDNKTFEWAHYDICDHHFTPAKIIKAAKELAKSPGNNLSSPEHDIQSLSHEDVIVDFCKLHYGKKDKNPLDTIKFYSKRFPNDSYHPKTGDVSTLVPTCFGEILLRIYTKKPEFFGLVQAGYRQLLQSLPDAVDLREVVEEEDDEPVPGAGRTGNEGLVTPPREQSIPPPTSTTNRKPPSTKRKLSESPKTGSWDNNNFNTVPLSYGSPTKRRKRD